MNHDVALISTIAMGFVVAFCFGFLAIRLRLPPLVGYLVAGIVLGTSTPGFVADAGMAGQLAEVGVILLMFGVGLHFSAADLMAVRSVAIPGAIAQIAVASIMGLVLAEFWGWSFGSGLIFGFSLSVASTVVLLRALDERNAVGSTVGRISVGWLIVEDLATVLALVLLPAMAGLLGGHAPGGHGEEAVAQGGAGLALTLAITLGKVGAFVALAMLLGPRAVPWLLKQVARTGSRELFTLAVLAVALGIAYGSAAVFGVSFALGAFFAGVVLSESHFSHRAAAESLPLQDAFAVLFFVSVGMLFDPSILIHQPLSVAAVLAVIVIGKSLAAFLIVLALGYPAATALAVSGALAQIGEFSFILAGLGIATGLLTAEARDLILAGALLSITLNPLVFAVVDKVLPKVKLMGGANAYGRDRLAALEVRLEETSKRQAEREAEHSLQIQQLVDRFPIFASLDSHGREDLLLLFNPRSGAPGVRLIRKGDRPDAAYFISSGAVQVSVGGRNIRLGPGDFFGEMALLSGARRTADVTCIDYCEFLVLTRRDFQSFVAKHPELREGLNKVAAEREAMNRQG
ncbi:cation:proton antiporter domain-containing protein [Ancylobacter terrae]|uniref:cation:proton antiporter domain-containing protein n=1 Tax=Ancylobacter sp. sgz301288 TaxID=3342077 RepID=UPI0038597561